MFNLMTQAALARIKAGGGVDPWDLSSNTVAQYKCNDDAASTTVTDEEGTNGTSSTNTSNLSVAGKINDAFDFTASSSEYVDMNQTLQATLRSAYNLSCWIKPDDGQPSANQLIWGATEGSDDQIQFILRDTGIITLYHEANNNAGNARTNSAVFADGATSWTHLSINVSATIIDIYVNGSQVALDVAYPGDMTGVTMGDLTMSVNPYLGARNLKGTGAVGFFDGPIDDFRIHDRVLTQTEIDGLYNSGSGTEAQSG